jgi:hypothetical protein
LTHWASLDFDDPAVLQALALARRASTRSPGLPSCSPHLATVLAAMFAKVTE